MRGLPVDLLLSVLSHLASLDMAIKLSVCKSWRLLLPDYIKVRQQVLQHTRRGRQLLANVASLCLTVTDRKDRHFVDSHVHDFISSSFEDPKARVPNNLQLLSMVFAGDCEDGAELNAKIYWRSIDTLNKDKLPEWIDISLMRCSRRRWAMCCSDSRIDIRLVYKLNHFFTDAADGWDGVGTYLFTPWVKTSTAKSYYGFLLDALAEGFVVARFSASFCDPFSRPSLDNLPRCAPPKYLLHPSPMWS